MKMFKRRKLMSLQIAAVVAATCVMATPAHALRLFETNPDWNVHLDTSFQQTLGFRMQSRKAGIANNPFFAEGDYKFNQGDIVTNRGNVIVSFTAVYKNHMGFRISGSGWKDFAYDDTVKTNPNFPGGATGPFSTYPSGHYSSTTYKYTVQGAEWLDAFAFYNGRVDNIPYYVKIGRFTQYWGNAIFFGFSNIAYGQNSIDFYKAFAQPGSQLQELYLPRGQAMFTINPTNSLSLTAEYFFENRVNRYPEGGTYLGPFDILYQGPTSGGALSASLGGPVSAGHNYQPNGINNNFGLRAIYSPSWLGGTLGVYYRQFADPHPWTLLSVNPGGGGALNLRYAQHTKLYGLSFEKTMGLFSLGAEVSYRQGTALSTAVGVASKGAAGDIYNVIGNVIYTMPSTPFWDTGNLIAEVSYTHLLRVSQNPALFNGVGYASCPSGNKFDGCATKNAVAVAFLFDPQWLQVFPNVNLDMPMSLTLGARGNPAYVAGAFYAQGAKLYSIGLRATYNSNSSLEVVYNGYYYHHSQLVPNGVGGQMYAGTGGNGAVALNDKGWIGIIFKTSF